jgi:hypothetical protein
MQYQSQHSMSALIEAGFFKEATRLLFEFPMNSFLFNIYEFSLKTGLNNESE